VPPRHARLRFGEVQPAVLKKLFVVCEPSQVAPSAKIGARQATCRFISCSGALFLLVNGGLGDRVALGVQRDRRDRCPVACMA